MRKKLAELLIRLAEWICPTIVPEETAWGVPKKVGLGLSISKKDISKYRKTHENIHSFRQAKREIIKDTQKQIGMSICSTLANRRLIHYDVHEKQQGAVVSGYLGIYVSKNMVKEIGAGEEDR